jgi:hypothetical protein
MDTGVLDFFNKKLILDYYFCLKSGPVFLFQIFIIAPLPLPLPRFNSGILLIIDLHKKKGKRGEVNFICEFYS